MLQIKNITKTYDTGALQQKALDDVSFNLRDNEFVSVLGHSGSGKTTLLNIIGGLDNYDSGDIIINDISTKKYTDRDWDSYRNHSVGFVFQSYNLIPHQTVLSNVELALTLSGISSSERKERAAKALEEVGLKDHLHKLPNQLSGGQMQRVAIARALVNEPDVLLAGEPTGALDTETSIQIMELLREVAKDRLVVMVTHNPNLAHDYSNRIIKLQEGKIISDSQPLNIEDEDATQSIHKNVGKSSMSFLTALSLSFNNLKSKKGRTFLTAFAGSIGIIGIALILSLSTGVNDYIDNIQQDTMTAYPITIEEQSIDLDSLMEIQDEAISDMAMSEEESADRDLDGVYSNAMTLELISSTTSTFEENNLTSFKEYLGDPSNEIEPYVGANGIVYSYDVKFDLFTYDEEDTLINTDGSTSDRSADRDLDGVYSNAMTLELISSTTSTFEDNNLTSFKEYLDDPSNEIEPYVGANGIVYSYDVKFDLFTYDEEDTLINTDGSTFREDESQGMPSMEMPESPFMPSRSNVSELIPGIEGNLISQVIIDNYDVLAGDWPEAYDEVVLNVDQNHEIETSKLYELGILPASEYEEILDQIDQGEKVELESQKLSYEEIMDHSFYLIPASDYFVEDDNGYFQDISEDDVAVENLIEESAIEIKIVGIVKPVEDATTADISTPIAYTNALTQHLIDYANKSDVIQAQEASPEINVLNGLRFETVNDDQKIEDTLEYLDSFTISEKAEFARSMQDRSGESEQMPGEMPAMSEEQLAAGFDGLVDSFDSETLLSIYDNSISPGNYDDNMANFGAISLDAPSSIRIYADNFEDKEAISAGIDTYNASVDEEEKITYADFAGLIMSSVTDIIDVITYVLIAFVSVSLIVSSIMIGIITYISVLERTKEIGILRAIGASKGNISTVFNAETFIIGLFSGLLGIGVTYLSHIPINMILEALLGEGVQASLSMTSSVVLVILSVILSFIAGLIPSRQASEKDPVDALRSE